MGLLKKLIIIVIILALYCLGNIEEPANELLSKGGSLFVLLVGAIIIYIFFNLEAMKMLKKDSVPYEILRNSVPDSKLHCEIWK